MSLFRCGGGGGKLDETVLWTNPNLTSDFASQTVTLSDNVDNYDFIKFVFNLSTTAATHRCSIYSVEELKTFVNPTNDWSRASSPMRSNSNNASFVRGIIYQSSNSLTIGNASGYQSSSTSNSALIPYQIIGMKYSGRSSAPTAVSGVAILSTSTTTKITLGFKPSYVALCGATRNAPISVYNKDVSTTSYFSSSSSYAASYNLPSSEVGRFYTIDDDGFTVNKASASTTTALYYFAIG